jgi:hypothetical protein
VIQKNRRIDFLGVTVGSLVGRACSSVTSLVSVPCPSCGGAETGACSSLVSTSPPLPFPSVSSSTSSTDVPNVSASEVKSSVEVTPLDSTVSPLSLVSPRAFPPFSGAGLETTSSTKICSVSVRSGENAHCGLLVESSRMPIRVWVPSVENSKR